MSQHGQEDEVSSDGGSEILPTTPKLRDDVRKILPSLPDSHLNAFVKELEKKYSVFSLEDDIPHVDKKELEKIEGLKGAQKAKFLEYAIQLRSPGAKEPRVISRAIDAGTVNIKNQAEVRAEASGSAHGSSGGSVLAEAIKAKEINVDDKAKMSAGARLEETDFSNAKERCNQEEPKDEPPPGMYN